jgi:flagellar motor protein MotB
MKARWYYAVDVAKRKPFAKDGITIETKKATTSPKKFVAFSNTDSQALEKAFLALDTGNSAEDDVRPATSTRVPVNEDYLFDVHIEKRELEPAYWLGPVYEVRRACWFIQDSATTLRPCPENLANQLEEGYLKSAPWRSDPGVRSHSQPRPRPKSQIIDGDSSAKPEGTATPTGTQSGDGPNDGYRLFGSYMNTTVQYHGPNTAYMLQDDFVSKLSSTMWERFGTRGGTKVVRGWTDLSAATETKSADKANISDKRSSRNLTSEAESPKDGQQPAPEPKKKRTALERQLSSLAGLAEDSNESKNQAEKEAQEEQQREMEDAREKDGEDQGRQIDHLVLVTHGIGQRLGLRLDSVNFVHDVNTLRKTIKAVYGAAPDLQAISGDSKNCRVQVLPVCWRHLLDFPKQSLKQNRKEFDLGDTDDALDDEYPSLQDITVDGVPAVRNLITDLAMDVLLYQSAYREHIASIVQRESNRVFQLFKKRTGFNGRVSLCGHSLGSAVYFDLLCRQDEAPQTRPRRVSSRATREAVSEQSELKLDFEVDNFFAIGSPIAMFQMLKGRTISGRSSIAAKDLAFSPFDPDPMGNDPFGSVALNAAAQNRSKDLIPITTSSPKCKDFFNIFHPTDPIAYRIEPLISPAMAQLKPQPLPYTKKGLFGAPGIANISQRVGQSVMSSWYGLTSGVASTLINRSLGITGEEQALPQDKAKVQPVQGTNVLSGQKVDATTPIQPSDGKKQEAIAEAAKNSAPDEAPTLIDGEIETLYAGFQKRRRSHASTASDEPSTGVDHEMEQERARKLRREEAKVKALNTNGRVDYHIQEGMFDVSLLASIASHLSYWADEDCTHFMLGQMLKKGRLGQSDIQKEKERTADLGEVDITAL